VGSWSREIQRWDGDQKEKKTSISRTSEKKKKTRQGGTRGGRNVFGRERLKKGGRQKKAKRVRAEKKVFELEPPALRLKTGDSGYERMLEEHRKQNTGVVRGKVHNRKGFGQIEAGSVGTEKKVGGKAGTQEP